MTNGHKLYFGRTSSPAAGRRHGGWGEITGLVPVGSGKLFASSFLARISRANVIQSLTSIFSEPAAARSLASLSSNPPPIMLSICNVYSMRSMLSAGWSMPVSMIFVLAQIESVLMPGFTPRPYSASSLRIRIAVWPASESYARPQADANSISLCSLIDA